MIKQSFFAQGLSLRSKLLGPLISISVVTFILTFWLFRWYLTDQFENEAKKRVETIASTIIYSCDASADPIQIQRLVTTLQLEKDVTMIMTLSGNPPVIFAASKIQWIGKGLSELKDFEERPFVRAAASTRGIYRYERHIAGTSIFISSLKFSGTNTQGILTENGAVYVELDTKALHKELSLAVLAMALGTLISISLGTFFIYLSIKRFILRPSDSMITTMDRRSKGDLLARVPVAAKQTKDKIVAISMALNEMLDELDRELERRSRIEQQLRESEVKLQELNSNKNKFFSIIAHDLKSPFNAILGFSELLHAEFDSLTKEEQKLYVCKIKDGLRNNYKLLENLLEWSRVQSGRFEFNPEPFDIGLLIAEMADTQSLSFEKKSQVIRIEIPDKTMVYADFNMTQTILRNLISNAIKFTDKHKTICIATTTPTESEQAAEGFVAIAVKDEGVGIKQKDLELLFRIDSGFHTKGTAKETGTGLGLILCYEFVARHGGKIWVTSEEGVGSVFSFTLPRLPI